MLRREKQSRDKTTGNQLKTAAWSTPLTGSIKANQSHSLFCVSLPQLLFSVFWKILFWTYLDIQRFSSLFIQTPANVCYSCLKATHRSQSTQNSIYPKEIIAFLPLRVCQDGLSYFVSLTHQSSLGR